MKFIKISSFLVVGAICISLISQVVFASTGQYSFILPAVGTLHSTASTKATTSTVAYNYAANIDVPGAGINCWFERYSDNMDLTVTAYYSGTGTVTMGYLTQSAATDNIGKAVYMAIKTSSDTWTKCYVNGTTQPN